MTTIRTILADDERIARARLRRLLTPENDIEIVAEAVDGPTAISAVNQQRPDLLFLDVQMPRMDGFEVLEALGARRPPVVVFATAFDEHAIHAFEQCALDYLLKPISPERLARTLNRVRDHLALVQSTPAAFLPAPDAADPSRPLRFSVRNGQRTSFVSVEEIDWIEADGNYAILHVGAQNHLLRETMSGLEAQLPAATFFRVGRSAILHLPRVREIQTTVDGRHFALLTDSQRVAIHCSVREIEKRLRVL